MKKVWFFDLDGTLADTDRDIRLAWKTAIARAGLECPSFDRDFVTGPPLDAVARKLFGDRCTPALGEELRRRFAEAYDACGLPMTREYPGVREAVSALRARGAQTAIVTNKRHAGALAVCEKFGWDGLFDRLYAGDMYDADPAIGRLDKARLLALAARESGAAAEECVMVGDTANDFSAASANGIDSIAVAWGYGTPAELALAGRIVRDPRELLEPCAARDGGIC